MHDFWSAYFYLHFYTVNTAKLSENVWKEAEKMLEQIQKYPQKEEYQKLVEADRINLYEREAEKGDDRKFLEETDRVFKENLRGDPAWKLYERKLVYLESKQPDISGEFERFLKKYPKVMDRKEKTIRSGEKVSARDILTQCAGLQEIGRASCRERV